MVFIESRQTKLDKMSMSRMFADSTDELDQMAVRLGLDPAWKRHELTPVEHFLVTNEKRRVAVRNGAVLLDVEVCVERLRKKARGLNTPEGPPPEWDLIEQAMREVREITDTLKTAVNVLGIETCVERWVMGMRRVVNRVAKGERESSQ